MSLSVAALACGGGETTEPPPPDPTITLSPTTLTLVAGTSGTINATINNGSGTINWSTSAPTVATVDQAGLVTGVAAGSATITAALASRPASSATASVTVTEPPPSATIAGITANGQPANLNALSKTISIEVNAQLPSGFQGTLEVQANGKTIGTLPVAAAAPPATGGPMLAPVRLVAEANTRSVQVIGAEDIVSRTPNGAYDLAAVIKTTPGQTVTTSPTIRGTFANRHDLVLVDGQVINGQSATNDQTQAIWSYGDLQLRLKGVSFDGSVLNKLDEASLENLDVTTGGTSAVFGADAVSGVVNVILRQNVGPPAGLLGIGEGRYGIRNPRITTSQGTYPADILNYGTTLPYPGAPTGVFNLDFRGPSVPSNPTLQLGIDQKWLKQSSSFQGIYLSTGTSWTGANPTVTDLGVGGITCKFYKGPAYTTELVTGADLGETPAANIGLRFGCRDKLNNWTYRNNTDGAGNAQAIGGDFTRPTSTFLNSLNNQPGITAYQVNPAAGTPLYPSYTDPTTIGGSSGIGGMRYLRGMVFAPGISPDASCVTGTFSNGQCDRLPFSASSYTPSLSLRGEYRYEASATDRAGNEGDPFTRWFLYDNVLPSVGSASASAALAAGQPVSFTFTATDNLEIAATAIAGGYSDVSPWIVWGLGNWGTPFDGQFVSSAQAQFDIPKLVTAVELAVPGLNGYYQPSGIPKPLTRVTWGAIDVAGGIKREQANVPATTNFQSFKVGPTGTDRGSFNTLSLNLCYRPAGTPGDCQGRPESAQVIYEQYYPAGGVDRIQSFSLAKSTTLDGQEVAFPRPPITGTTINFGSYYVRRFSDTILGTDYPPGSYKLFGLGYDGIGNALKTQELTLNVYNVLPPPP